MPPVGALAILGLIDVTLPNWASSWGGVPASGACAAIRSDSWRRWVAVR